MNAITLSEFNDNLVRINQEFGTSEFWALPQAERRSRVSDTLALGLDLNPPLEARDDLLAKMDQIGKAYQMGEAIFKQTENAYNTADNMRLFLAEPMPA